VSDLPLPLSCPSSLSSYFPSPVQLRRGSDIAALVVTWYLSRLNQNSWKADRAGFLSIDIEIIKNSHKNFAFCQQNFCQ